MRFQDESASAGALMLFSSPSSIALIAMPLLYSIAQDNDLYQASARWLQQGRNEETIRRNEATSRQSTILLVAARPRSIAAYARAAAVHVPTARRRAAPPGLVL